MTRPEDLPAEEEASRRGSPAAAVALVSAVLALATAFNPSAPAVALFFALAALAALPMALADRRDLTDAPRRRADKQVLAAAVLTAGALLALGTAFLAGEQQSRIQDSRVVPTGAPSTPQASPRPTP